MLARWSYHSAVCSRVPIMRVLSPFSGRDARIRHPRVRDRLGDSVPGPMPGSRRALGEAPERFQGLADRVSALQFDRAVEVVAERDQSLDILATVRGHPCGAFVDL